MHSRCLVNFKPRPHEALFTHGFILAAALFLFDALAFASLFLRVGAASADNR